MHIKHESCRRAARLALVAGAAALLAACAQPKPMYTWDTYQPALYAYLKEDGADYSGQALAMEKNIETARATNQVLPPGFRAHLGMLYLKMGDGDKAAAQIEGEKTAFPEAAPFMDFLLRNAGGAKSAAAQPPADAPAQTSADISRKGT